MQCDASRYASFVDSFDITPERKVELIRIVWTMMQSFVDRAFGDAPEQNILGKTREPITACPPDGLGSGLTLTPPFNETAGELPRKSKP